MRPRHVPSVVAMALSLSACEWWGHQSGQTVYVQQCAACHGAQGEAKPAQQGSALAGLPAWYVERQLTRYRQGARGSHVEDVEGLRMRLPARLLRPEQVPLVAEYVASLPRPVAAPRSSGSTGDVTRGQETYALCLACHGEDARGSEAIGAPPLAGQSGWYLLGQLRKFRAGVRGGHVDDGQGAQMQPMAQALADEQAMQDVVAYVGTR